MEATIYTQTMTINGVEYTLEQDRAFTAEELAAINDAPYAYILAGDTANCEEFALGELVVDQECFITDQGEWIVLTYEEITEEQHDWTQDNAVVYYQNEWNEETQTMNETFTTK